MKLIKYSTSSGGGMLGGNSSMRVEYDKDGKCFVEKKTKDMHSSPTYTTSYYADGFLEKLSTACEKYNVRSWTDLPDEDLRILDGESHSYYFTFEDGLSIRLGSDKKAPANWRDFWNEVSALLEDAEKNATDRKTTKEENGSMMFGFINNASMSEVQQTKPQALTKSKFCSTCGTKFDNDDQKFCPNCGAVRK